MTVSAVSGAATPHTMSGASRGAPPQQKMSKLFDAIDSGATGSISQAQFQQAFQTMNPPAAFQQQGASAIFAALDPSGTGNVSRQQFVSGMSDMMASLRADPSTASAAGASASANASLQALGSLPGGPGSQLNLQS